MQVKYVKINLDKLCKLICFYYLLPPLVNLHNLDKNVSFTLG